MRFLRALTLASLGVVALAPVAPAQSVDFMLNECSGVGQTYFRDFTARTKMKYNGRRVDGTHAINGRIFLETRFEDFACSYDRSGRRMVEFFAEGRPRNAFLPGGGGHVGGGGHGGGPSVVEVTGVSRGDVLNVRSGPGVKYRVIGALANGDRVRNLRCQGNGRQRWCEIEMMTDMRERGWVNGRFLTEGGATHLPSPPGTGTGDATSTVRVHFAPGTSHATITEALRPGESRRYVLGARARQELSVRVEHLGGPRTDYQIFNPDRSFLLDMIPTDREYRGELWQTGDHVIEVINRGGRTADYRVTFRIR